MAETQIPPDIRDIEASGSEDLEFRCPYCDATYDHEWLTRIHITRSDDKAHNTHDGLMPETPVAVVENDDEIGEVKRHPDEIDYNTLKTSDLPDRYDSAQKRILLLAANNPYVGDYSELHERAQRVFEQRNLGDVSYSTVRRLVKDFYEPANETDSTASETRYEELTEKQQRVIDAFLENPSATYSEIAEEADTSAAYPGQVLSKYEDLVRELEPKTDSQGDEGDSKGREDHQADGDDAESDVESLTSADEDDTPPSEERATADQPVNTPEAAIMTATPYGGSKSPSSAAAASTLGSTDSEVDNGASDNGSGNAEQSVSVIGSPIEAETEERPEGGSGMEKTLAEELEDLQEHIAFLRSISERQVETGGSSPVAETQYALASEIESRLAQIIAGSE